MRLVIVTDAWYPQVNGVIRTLDRSACELRRLGHDVHMLTHEGRRTLPLPSYPEVRLALARPAEIARQIADLAPDCVHIATEGTLGWLVRRHCLKHGLNFTTSFHSRFPEMIAERLPVPGIERLSYRVLRRFHAPAVKTLAPTKTVTERLRSLGFGHVVTWTRGVDRDVFQPTASQMFAELPRPLMLYAGRVAVEKNLEAFLGLDVPGSKVVVGGGPQLEQLKNRYCDVTFTGYLHGTPLAQALSAADVFVFPSKSDTFGLVMLEALSCGTPVAAFPVEGPIDVITDGAAGALDNDLRAAIAQALKCDRQACQDFASQFTWQRVAKILEKSLVPVTGQAVPDTWSR